VDRSGLGARLPVDLPSAATLRLSPDGRLAAVTSDREAIAIVDLNRGTKTLLDPQNPGAQQTPVWSLDGRFVTFAAAPTSAQGAGSGLTRAS
jgi:tricorn protease-like protein